MSGVWAYSSGRRSRLKAGHRRSPPVDESGRMPDTGVAIVSMDKPSLAGSRDLCPVR